MSGSLTILASRHDHDARALADRWSGHDVRLLTPGDLSLPGFCHHVGDADRSVIVAQGTALPNARIAAVLTLLPCVDPNELEHIAPVDRAYVAAEMGASLSAWLSELTCPVLNRPTPVCLMGPSWGQQQWLHAASKLDIPVRSLSRHTRGTLPNAQHEPVTAVTVIGACCLGDDARGSHVHARRLARALGLELLTVYFAGPQAPAGLLGADLRVDIRSPSIADALLERLLEHRRWLS